MPEMLAPTSAIQGRGLGTKVALITDGRFSGASEEFQLDIFHQKLLKADRLH